MRTSPGVVRRKVRGVRHRPRRNRRRIPEELSAVDAAPLPCAGITTFDAFRNTDAKPGYLVARRGVGGLGHLAIQYAQAAGFETVALSRSPDKAELALELGAEHFVDTTETDAAEAIQSLGGARIVLATAPAADAISEVVGGLGRDGEVVVVDVPDEAVEVDAAHPVRNRGTVSGWASGHAKD